ncbi:hypothetical protein F5878DRAFT_336880 [Lentinula raphanica]|uniref:Uncharacterized protein n=1 Tax=Lentinula raphanica TaxID=153919 RepID=A0AA38P2F9_9AGAR|nr:hypothetical protein F5878DRAFT_336880 [Lentinula raphanica]
MLETQSKLLPDPDDFEGVLQMIVVANGEDQQSMEHSISSLSPQPKLLPYPEDASHSTDALSWFREAFDYVNVDLGEDFTCTIQSWIELERTKGWISSPKGIACKNRPKELTRWIINGRYNRRANEPRFGMSELASFGKSFVIWWTSLKQSASESQGQGQGRKGNGWGTLDVSGKNGWLSIVVCLKWWGMGLGEHRQEALGVDWRQSVIDVRCTLNQLVSFNASLAKTLL